MPCSPGAQQPANHNETALVKDASISSTLLALIAQQDDENVAAEGQVMMFLVLVLLTVAAPQPLVTLVLIHAGKRRIPHCRA